MNKTITVYLTRSSEVAILLSIALQTMGDTGLDNLHISHGKVNDRNDYIPRIYAEEGYFHCMAEYDSPCHKYELIFA